MKIRLLLILLEPVCHFLCRCVSGQETYCCVMATVTEPFTLSVLACQQLARESSSVMNATLVGVPCSWHRIENTLSNFTIILPYSVLICFFLLPSGVHICFVCKKSGNGVKRCMIPLCGKFYHTDCIMAFSATQPHNKGFRCPLHVCLSCHITNRLNICSKGMLWFWFGLKLHNI